MFNTIVNLRTARGTAIAAVSCALFAFGTGSAALAGGPHGPGAHGGPGQHGDRGNSQGRGERRAPARVYAPQPVFVPRPVFGRPEQPRPRNRGNAQPPGQIVSHVWAPSRKRHRQMPLPGTPAVPAAQAYSSAQAYYDNAPVYNAPINYGNPSAYYNAPPPAYYGPANYGPGPSYNFFDSILGSLLGGGSNGGLGSIFGGGNNGSIASVLAPIAIGALLNGELGQNGLGSILTGGLPAGYLQPVGYAPIVNYAPQQQVSGTVLSASGSNITVLTSNNQEILVNDSSAQFNGPVNVGQWITISGYPSGNQFVATNIG
ncbi:MAG: hypothetical protein ACYDGM_01005 [Vulcanimicrobiaceae bacterium]